MEKDSYSAVSNLHQWEAEGGKAQVLCIRSWKRTEMFLSADLTLKWGSHPVCQDHIMSTCIVGTIQQYSVCLTSWGGSQAKGLGVKQHTGQAEAVGPMA